MIIQFARENRSWGYDRISGALANLGHKVSDQGVANILKCNGVEPVKKRKNGAWVTQITRNVTSCDAPIEKARYLIHDRDPKYCRTFRNLLEASGIEPLKLPARSPNLNAYAERFVRSIKEECLSNLILFGEKSLRHVLK